MKQNPVYNREMRVSSRSMKLPLIIFLFNGILFLVTLLNMYSVIMQVKASASIQYSSFMELYEFVTSMEFILLMFIVPAVTASAISGERERQTLDLMLTTRMSAGQIVTGKLLSALSTLFLLILSSFPAVAMVFVYGGITWTDAFSLILCYVTVAFFAGSIGICFSTVFLTLALLKSAFNLMGLQQYHLPVILMSNSVKLSWKNSKIMRFHFY